MRPKYLVFPQSPYIFFSFVLPKFSTENSNKSNIILKKLMSLVQIMAIKAHTKKVFATLGKKNKLKI